MDCARSDNKFGYNGLTLCIRKSKFDGLLLIMKSAKVLRQTYNPLAEANKEVQHLQIKTQMRAPRLLYAIPPTNRSNVASSCRAVQWCCRTSLEEDTPA